MHAITDAEFGRFRRFIYEAAGISLSPAKKTLVAGRLSKRLEAHRLATFSEYFAILSGAEAGDEVQTAIDLLTTNETYFFREPKHFEMLDSLACAAAVRSGPFRVWSAASSSGEEGYSIAMVLHHRLGPDGWDVLGTDISRRVLQRARAAHYPLERARHIPSDYLKRYCLRGTGRQDGTLLVERALRQRVSFSQVNLNEPLPRLGTFDVVFLRNVMIYFDGDTKRQVIARVASALKPGGHLFIGHSESLHEISSSLQQVAPSIYRKP